MKKLFTTIAILMIALAASAQNYNVWNHHANNPIRQCADILELSDGNLVVFETVFDDNQNDVGYNLYKITPQGELLDSLFVEDHHISGLYPVLRDPDNPGVNIMTSFFNIDDVSFLRKVSFSDDMELVCDDLIMLSEDCPLPGRLFVDPNNDILYRKKIDDSHFKLYRIGLDGELKAVSDTIDIVGDITCPEFPFAVYSTDPLQYVYVYYGQNFAAEIYDADLNLVQKKVFKNIEGYGLAYGWGMNVCGTGEEEFVVTFEVAPKSWPTPSFPHYLMVLKVGENLEIKAKYLGEEFYPVTLNNNSYFNRNLVANEDGVYVVWEKKTVASKDSKKTVMVTALDKDLQKGWEISTSICVYNGDMIGNYGIELLENNNLAFCGWLTGPYYYDSQDIYAVVVENENYSTPEISASENPFVCYPNPAKDILNINFADDNECQSVAIYSIDGRLTVETFPETSQSSTINIANLTPGLYLIKVRMSDGKEFSEKIVVK